MENKIYLAIPRFRALFGARWVSKNVTQTHSKVAKVTSNHHQKGHMDTNHLGVSSTTFLLGGANEKPYLTLVNGMVSSKIMTRFWVRSSNLMSDWKFKHEQEQGSLCYQRTIKGNSFKITTHILP